MFNDIHFKAMHFLLNAKLCRTNAYEFQYTIAELHIFFAASLQLLCNNAALMSWKTTFNRIRLEDKNIHVYFGHFNSFV